MALLTPEEMNSERIRNMARVFTKVDRVLSGRGEVRCEVTDSGRAPAWSDGRTITFNIGQIGSVTSIEDIIQVTGLNYHELAHVLYTPRSNSKMVKEIIAAGAFPSFNILEDQRIETLLTATYPATAPYFVTTFMRYCLKDEQQWESNFVLAHGRKYLPKKVRDQFVARFVRQDLVQDFIDVIEEYRLLNVMKKDTRAVALVVEFHKLLQEINPPQQPYGHGEGRDEVGDKSTPDSAREQEDAKEWAEWYDEEREENEESDTDTDGAGSDSPDDEDEDSDDGDSGSSGDEDSEEDDSDSDDEDGSDGDGSDDGDGDEGEDGDGSDSGDASDDDDSESDAGSDGSSTEGGKGDGEASDSDASGSEDGDSDDADSAGTSGGDAPTLNDSDLRDLMDEVAKQIESDEDVQREAKSKQRSIVGGDGDTSQVLDMRKYTFSKPTPEIVNASKKFGKQLERLRADLDPGWHTHKSSGRINIQRAIHGADLDTVWDQWDEGKADRSDIECVLYVDFSSSMNAGQMAQACQAMWGIKRAIEAIDGSVTVYAYNTSSYLIYRADQKAEHDKVRVIGSSGGTDPSEAIKDSLRVFHNSRKATKIALFLTDGQWSNYQWGATADEMWPALIKRMNDHGIVTALGYIGGGYNITNADIPEYARNGCRLGHYLRQAGDLIPFAKAIVTEAMRNGVV